VLLHQCSRAVRCACRDKERVEFVGCPLRCGIRQTLARVGNVRGLGSGLPIKNALRMGQKDGVLPTDSLAAPRIVALECKLFCLPSAACCSRLLPPPPPPNRLKAHAAELALTPDQIDAYYSLNKEPHAPMPVGPHPACCACQSPSDIYSSVQRRIRAKRPVLAAK
jgi:hypothetical protein